MSARQPYLDESALALPCPSQGSQRCELIRREASRREAYGEANRAYPRRRHTRLTTAAYRRLRRLLRFKNAVGYF